MLEPDYSSYSPAAIEMIWKTCVHLHDLGEALDRLGGYFDTALRHARAQPTFPWENRYFKAIYFQDIGSAMGRIGFEKSKVIGVLQESLREACAINGAHWGNRDKSKFIRELKAQIQKLG